MKPKEFRLFGFIAEDFFFCLFVALDYCQESIMSTDESQVLLLLRTGLAKAGFFSGKLSPRRCLSCSY